MNSGYQPNKGYLNPKNPPKGGSGVPNKIIKGEMVITKKMTELERAKKWFNDLDYSDRLDLMEMYIDPDDLRGEIGDFYKYMDNDLKLEMYRENKDIYGN